jgi:Tol biopolymer transport system component
VLTLKGHSHRIYFAAVSPDGQRIVTGSEDRTAKVWEANTGQELLELRGHLAGIESVAFSPDGRRIATGSLDGRAKVWDAATGQELLTFKGHSSWIMSVAFSPDGQRIVTGSEDKTAKVWEAATGSELLTLQGHSALVNCVAFSPDGRRIATASVDETAKMWEAATGKELFTCKGQVSWVRAVAFSPDGQWIVTGSEDKTARVWQADSGKELFELRGHNAALERVAFSPDGRRIVTGSLDGTAKVWDTATAKELLTLKGHSSWVLAVAFTPDGRRILTGSDDHTAKLWESASVAQVARWQESEQIAADRLGAQQRERAARAESDRALCANDPGAIKQWLVLLPILFPHTNSLRTSREGEELPHGDGEGVRAIRQEQLAQEGQLRPRAGQREKVGSVDLVWRPVEQADYVLDFNRLAGAETQTWWSVAYAVTYIHSETAHRNVVLKVGSEDESRVYLNGKLIQENLSTADFFADQDPAAGQELKAGLNVLVFKVVNEDFVWRGSIRFTDAAGQPLKGIRVTLDPDEFN